MSDKFLRHYRILGLEPGCTLRELKTAYRRLARKWHPDRHIESSATGRGRRPAAEERFKEINQAYWSLSNYHRQHGRLPLESGASAVWTPKDEPGNQPDGASSERPESAWQPFPYRRYLFTGAFLGIGLAVVLWYDRPTTDTSTPPSPPSALDESRVRGKGTFSVGSTLGDVYAAQGAPTWTEGDTWHYGKSRVHFSNGRVTNWEENPGNPLLVTRPGGDGAGDQATFPTSDFFSVGSTKEEVRAVQGKPLRETDTLWEYRVSRVYFKNGRVTSWYSSPLDPLRAQEKSR